jgi:hypothetical protein
VSTENKSNDAGRDWLDASRRMFEEYVSSSASLTGRYFEACRKYAAPPTRRQALDELLQTAIDAASLVPRLAIRHLKPESGQGAGVRKQEQPAGILLKTAKGSPVCAELVIDNPADNARSVRLSLSPFLETDTKRELPSDKVTLSPAEFDLEAKQSLKVMLTIDPSQSSLVAGKSYSLTIVCTGGLEGAVEVGVEVE